MKVHKVWSNIRKYQRLVLLERSYRYPSCMLSPTRCFSIPRIYESDAEDCSQAPQQGYLAVYVGPGRLRFLMKTHYLNHPLFRELLEKSEEEFEFQYDGGITIQCEVEAFESLLWQLAKAEESSSDSDSAPSSFTLSFSLSASPLKRKKTTVEKTV